MERFSGIVCAQTTSPPGVILILADPAASNPSRIRPLAELLGKGRVAETGLNVFVAGLRGIPDIQGGVERHCQSLYPRLVRAGGKVTVFARSGYVPGAAFDFQGVRVMPLRVARSTSVEALAHTGLAVLRAKSMGAKLLHIHGIGPAIWTPLATRLGMKVVVTHHGFDYNRQKWGTNAKRALRLGESNAIRYADGIVCISKEILDYVRGAKPKGIVEKIPNGVERPAETPPAGLLDKWNLRAGAYFLLTSRFVREKGIPDLIRGWVASGLSDRCGLAIAGGEDHPSPYGESIRKLAAESGAVLTGVVAKEELGALYGHARGFMLPSYHEGLPISLLEAMSWGLPLGASSILPNLEVGLAPEAYFPVGDADAIATRLRQIAEGPHRVDHSALLVKYDWDAIADSTLRFYRNVMDPASRVAA